MKKIMVGLTCSLLMTTMPVLAAPSVNGSTGLINTPTADVLRGGQVSVGYYHLKDGGVGTFNTNIAPNLEIGVAAFRYDGQKNESYVNAKFGLVPETIMTPGLSIGVEDMANRGQRSLYAVASKALPFGFRIHAGTGNGRFNGVFGGIEKTINPLSVLTGNNAFPATTLIAEYDGKVMNYGARLSIVPGLKLDAGVRNHDGYIGISFTN
ncbi:YjbH domain-containing protein [Pelosinus sp. sgz500959]|uniref:YjbH domain-containing protein n=1 Tax=Pelosinus sp. sgz500959 TaxID=3242472 RepID=UPI003670102D